MNLKKYEIEPITSIEEVILDEDITVYDFEVEDDHSYVVEGVAVHNSVCTTKLQTGFSRPQFSAVLECSKSAKKPIVADGGITYNGDIAKALVAGADMVMCGGIFAGHDESPGERVTYVDERGNTIGEGKSFFGSASEHNKNAKKHVEGKKIVVHIKGPIAETYQQITESLRSSISYAGGQDLSAFNSLEWVAHNQ
jgi:GMP reductase